MKNALIEKFLRTLLLYRRYELATPFITQGFYCIDQWHKSNLADLPTSVPCFSVKLNSLGKESSVGPPVAASPAAMICGTVTVDVGREAPWSNVTRFTRKMTRY